MSDNVTFTMPIHVYQTLKYTSWPDDCPSGWLQCSLGTVRKYGKGRSIVVTMTREDATNLADYLFSVWDVLRDQYDGQDRGGWANQQLKRVEKGLAR